MSRFSMAMIGALLGLTAAPAMPTYVFPKSPRYKGTTGKQGKPAGLVKRQIAARRRRDEGR